MNPIVHHFTAADGIDLAWHELGPKEDGARPVVLLHGLFSDAFTNWLRYGHAAAVAARGFRVIMPDLRAHGQSGKPHDPAFYPPDILATDGLALLAHLGLEDYDLGGYSLGARTSVRMVALGAAPKKLIVSGMGLSGLHSTGRRSDHFKRILAGLGTHERGSPEWMAEAFLKTTRGDPVALLRLIDSFTNMTLAEVGSISQPVLVLSGVEDQDNGSAEELAGALPEAIWRTTPGGHMSAVIKPELGREIADFLAA